MIPVHCDVSSRHAAVRCCVQLLMLNLIILGSYCLLCPILAHIWRLQVHIWPTNAYLVSDTCLHCVRYISHIVFD